MKNVCLLLFSLMAFLCFVSAGTPISLSVKGTYATGIFDDSAAEIVAFDAATDRLFVVNGASGAVDVLNISDPANPTLAFTIDISSYGDQANSVAVHNGTVAVAVAADPKTDNGVVVFFNTGGTFQSQVTVGALPDMLTFTPDGGKVLVANEGEPSDDITTDPEGSISIIDLSGGVASLTQGNVTTAGFTAFNGQTLDASIRIFTPGATVAQDLEPEYIAVSADSATAWVALQENNAVAVVDVNAGTVTSLIGLGFKDHSVAGNGIDASNRDDAINIANYPVFGMFQPDAMVAFESGGQTYLFTANEGDSRDYGGFSEEERVGDLTLDPTAFPNAATLQENENLGRLKITTTLGDTDNDMDYDELYAYGARSFSVWNGATGALVYDSGDDLEVLTSTQLANNFNSNNDDNDSFDSRSDDKGPEPEGVAVGQIAGVNYGFVGLERVGGIAMYNLATPTAPAFVTYINNRDFSADAETAAAGDLGPEGLTFISAADSPTLIPMLAVGNEVSGTTTLFEVGLACATPTVDLAPVGQNGITINGSYDCAYDVLITQPGGASSIQRVLVGAGGTATIDMMITDGLQVEAGAPGSLCAEPRISNLGAIGTTGLTVSGTAGCSYDVRITNADGTVTVERVTIGDNGTAELNVLIQPDALYEVGQAGAGNFGGAVQTVPTLGEWALIAMVLLMMGSVIYFRRRHAA
ncbi:choice-of-anchor I family protein [Acanthopleuribacter pedis]|uniref:Choice-of-anchor I family protein n=1 Tax=Acanthopleuribacter pedis TaxID=442870 RepID=A0A8J7Q8E8_9BACT|nr:choice-of-anchor I family protein [Acanthopleuribacter pedis]MBO1319329.1 choice-of-anchor I family protein [Acanthopleuribacter pedis]